MILIKVIETSKYWRKILTDLLSFLGVIVFLIELANLLKINIAQELFRNYFLIILIICFIISVFKNWAVLEKTFKVQNADIHITIVIKDLLKQNGSIIIPTNTTFDTTLKDSFISLESVQGQFQKKYFEFNLDDFDALLDSGVKSNNFTTLTDNRKTKKRKFELGTVSKVNWKKNHYYFLAVSDINEYGKPINVSYSNLTDSLSRLWQQLEEFGNVENISVPLICTGKVGHSEITRFKAFRELVDSFIAISSQSKLTENLCIVINPKDIKNKKIDFEQICEYAKFKCMYKDEISNEKDGTQL